MSNVHALPGLQNPTDTEPIEELVLMLRDLLADAESGRLRSLIGTGFLADGCRISVWADNHQNVYEMRGALAWLGDEYVHRHTGVEE
jgi:hypothetical protein